MRKRVSWLILVCFIVSFRVVVVVVAIVISIRLSYTPVCLFGLLLDSLHGNSRIYLYHSLALVLLKSV